MTFYGVKCQAVETSKWKSGHKTLNYFQGVNKNEVGNSDNFASDKRPLNWVLAIKKKSYAWVFFCRGSQNFSGVWQERFHPEQTTKVFQFNLQSKWNNKAFECTTWGNHFNWPGPLDIIKQNPSNLNAWRFSMSVDSESPMPSPQRKKLS